MNSEFGIRNLEFATRDVEFGLDFTNSERNFRIPNSLRVLCVPPGAL